MDLILITGFLGSGKTTFLSKLLKDFKDTKIGVIVNEFGEKGIDGKLIQSNNIDLFELNNGSIFCSCIKGDFINALAEMTKYPLDYVIVEASGLSDPSNIKVILETVNKTSKDKYNYVGSVCIIDALYFLPQFDLLPALKRQIEYSGAVIINKIDLQSKEKIKQITNKLLEVNPDVKVYKTIYCDENIKNIINNLDSDNRISIESTNTWENRPKTVYLESDVPLDITNLERFLKEINGSSYRIKGFANTDKGLYKISSVNKQLEISPWTKTEESTQIVIISSVGIKIISLVAKAKNQYLIDLKIST